MVTIDCFNDVTDVMEQVSFLNNEGVQMIDINILESNTWTTSDILQFANFINLNKISISVIGYGNNSQQLEDKLRDSCTHNYVFQSVNMIKRRNYIVLYDNPCDCQDDLQII